MLGSSPGRCGRRWVTALRVKSLDWRRRGSATGEESDGSAPTAPRGKKGATGGHAPCLPSPGRSTFPEESCA
jgi:hypothetical protein